jgi:glycosyltransferase involved in cell wall biosynthesis
MVLEAFAAISDELPQWKLVLIGPPEDGFSDYFSRFIKEHENLADRIIFVGYLKTRKEVFDYYIRSKIIAFPSRYESFGLVIAEAGACGVVPVATQIPSLIDLTDNGRLGYLCPIDDTYFFTNQLRYAMSHDEELREKSHEMVHYIQNRFEWSAICSRLQELLY